MRAALNATLSAKAVETDRRKGEPFQRLGSHPARIQLVDRPFRGRDQVTSDSPQVLVNLADYHRTFANGGGHSPYGPITNVAGNKHRMITAIHYNTGKVFVLAIIPHAEYGKQKWKETL